MSAWSIATLHMDEELLNHNLGSLEPTQFVLDSGVDNQGWAEDRKLYFALSYGRYQACRFEKHMEDLYAPQFTAVKRAFIADVENTGDNALVKVFEPKQRRFDDRVDGYEQVDSFEGKRWTLEKRMSLLDRIEEEYNVRPMIEPESQVPPDMILSKNE